MSRSAACSCISFQSRTGWHAVLVDSWQVLAVMDLLAAEGVIGWIDGGWGVDALLGEQTRPHADLDLAVDEKAVHRLVPRLRTEGYSVLRDELPAGIALRHDDGREVDLHPLALTPDGGGDQQQPGGRPPWHYGPPSVGHINGRPVPCNSLDTQLRSHLGYEPDQDDYADMRALAGHFECPLPAPYDRPWPS
jgi:lincosamide nucleotidyltransferase A/C/D/E